MLLLERKSFIHKLHSAKKVYCRGCVTHFWPPGTKCGVEISTQIQHIPRQSVKRQAQYAITKIKGIGRRFSNLILKKCDVDIKKRAGELTPEEINKIVAVVANPTQFRIPSWSAEGKGRRTPCESGGSTNT